jgi:hypothetical protein
VVLLELCAGLPDEETLLSEAVDWPRSTSAKFREENHRPLQLLASGDWGRRYRIFFDNFYGVRLLIACVLLAMSCDRHANGSVAPHDGLQEGLELLPGKTYARAADEKPFAGLVWSGRGRLNGLGTPESLGAQQCCRRSFGVCNRSDCRRESPPVRVLRRSTQRTRSRQ